jgi:hypothetical protein
MNSNILFCFTCPTQYLWEKKQTGARFCQPAAGENKKVKLPTLTTGDFEIWMQEM